MTEKESSATPSDDASFIDIHYLKTTDFREVACDGALGGPTPHGKLWLAFYSERFPLPRVMRQKVNTSAQGVRLDNETPATVVEARHGLIRNVEFGVYMSLDTAADLHQWLGEYLAKEKRQGEK